MLAVLSALVASACVLASARRLRWACSPAWLDPQLLAEALHGDHGVDLPRLRTAVAACEPATWERELFDAIGGADEVTRVSLVNEQLRELDWLSQRWARVPRVCASVATSAGFLCACVALIRGVDDSNGVTVGVLVSALDAFAIGIAGTSFCVAVHLRARRVVRERLAATDRLLDRIERLCGASLARNAAAPVPAP